MINDLLFLYDRNLRYAKSLVEDVDDSKMAIQPAPAMNHPAWTLGHLAVTGDVLLQMFGHTPACPADWKDNFGRESTPSSDRSRYPSKEKLIEALERTHASVKETLSHVDPRELDTPPPQRYVARFPTKRTLVIQMLTGHEQTHLGQLSAWRRIQGMPPV
jgi:hypothetical protein